VIRRIPLIMEIAGDGEVEIAQAGRLPRLSTSCPIRGSGWSSPRARASQSP
jgi:hypothetical protein